MEMRAGSCGVGAEAGVSDDAGADGGVGFSVTERDSFDWIALVPASAPATVEWMGVTRGPLFRWDRFM